MDFAFVVRQRLGELGLGQHELAAAAEVTQSYISQLLGRKKLPPLPNRTDLYDKMSRLLGVPRDELARLAALQHHEILDRRFQTPPEPRFGNVRKGYSNGDGNTEADVRPGLLGTALNPVNPTLAGNLMWAWRQSNSGKMLTEDSQFGTTLTAEQIRDVSGYVVQVLAKP